MNLIWDNNNLGELRGVLSKYFSFLVVPSPLAVVPFKNNEICIRISHPDMFTGTKRNNIITYSVFSVSPVVNNVCELTIIFYGQKDYMMRMEERTREALSSIIQIGKKYSLYDINFKLVYFKNIFEDLTKTPTRGIVRFLDYPNYDIVQSIDDKHHRVKITIPPSVKDESGVINFIGDFINNYVNNSIKLFVTKVTPENILSHYIEYIKQEIRKFH